MNGRQTDRTRLGRRPRTRTLGHGLEALERRALLTTFTVTNTGDLTPTGAVIAGSLRDAINKANSNPGPDLINFNIGGSGVHIISISPPPTVPQPLPAIIDQVTIDGTTQPGYADRPLIQIDGQFAGNAANGLRIAGGSSIIKGLAISRFSSAGIRIESSGIQVYNCFIGTDANGTIDQGNGGFGIVVDGASSNTIGGTAGGQLNLISGNDSGGILLTNGSTNNQILNNFIGTGLSATGALANSGPGIEVISSSFNRIGGPDIEGGGGTTLHQGNVISGNSGDGVLLFGAGSTTNIIQGNTIGLSQGGGSAVPNQGNGISVQSATRNQIGGASAIAGTGNVISGNGLAGVSLLGADGTTIQGNRIGTDALGTANLGNGGAGVFINGGNSSSVGGADPGLGNIIAFNGRTTPDGGVRILLGTGIPVLYNSIFSNNGLGIDLFSTDESPTTRVTPNHPGGTSTGPNNLQNYPDLTAAVTGAGRTLIQGTMNAAPNSSYTLQFFSSVAKDPSGFGEGQTVIGQAAITTDGNGVATINVILPAPSTVGQFITATATNAQKDTSEFSAAVQIGVAQIANLAVQVAAAPSPATLGGNLTYTITVTNNGPSPATGVTLADTYPSTTQFVTATTTQGTVNQGTGSITVALGTLAPGASATVTLVVNTTAVGAITNVATVSSNEIDPDTTNNTVTTTTQVNIPADLTVTVTDAPDPVRIGNNVSYTVIVTNNGPGLATNVVLTDILPANATYVTSSSGQGSLVQVGNQVIATLGTLSAGASTAILIVVAPTTPGVITNTATATLDQIDPNPADNTDSEDTAVEPSADLSLTVSASPEPVLVGQNLTYVVTITNNGPTGATNVFLNDTLPDDVTLVSAVTSQGTVLNSIGSVIVSLGSIDLFGTATVTIVVTPGVSERITNVAAVTASEFDADTTNNTVTTVSTVSPSDLSVVIVPSPSPVLAGDNLTYTVLVTNNGPADATGVTLLNQIPTGVTFVSATATQGTAVLSGNTITGDLGTIASGNTVAVTVVVVPSSPGTVVDIASVSGNELDVDASNNVATSSVLVSPVDLSLSTSVDHSSILLGGNLTYTIIVTNRGPATATNVLIGDALPGGTVFVSGSSTQGQVLNAGSIILIPVGSLAPGESVGAVIVVKTQLEGTAINNVLVKSDQDDTNPADNSGVSATDVLNLPGEFDFSSPSYTVAQNGQFATVTINRVGGSKGAASVAFTAASGTARANIDFQPSIQIVSFADGQTSQNVVVPILNDGQNGPDRTVILSLSDAVTASIGATSTATLTIVNVNPDLVPPAITNIQFLGAGSINTIVVSFSKTLDRPSASNPGNYNLFTASGSPIGVASVVFDPNTNLVTITPSRPLAAGPFYRLEINASNAFGVTDNTPSHNLLDGDANGTAGGNYEATFARSSTIRYTDANGDSVTFRLTGGGILELFRATNGDGQVLRVLGARPYRSTLSGSVRASRFGGDGVTTLQAIEGLTPFGTVRTQLSGRRFIVGNQPIIASSAVSAASATHSVAVRLRRSRKG